MISTFKNKDLQELRVTGKSAKIDAKLQPKILHILDALDQAKTPDAMNIPGFGFHGLKGMTPERYALSVNGPWRITFEFEVKTPRALTSNSTTTEGCTSHGKHHD